MSKVFQFLSGHDVYWNHNSIVFTQLKFIMSDNDDKNCVVLHTATPWRRGIFLDDYCTIKMT